MSSLLKKHQLIVFFALTVAIGWFPWYANAGRGSVFYSQPVLYRR